MHVPLNEPIVWVNAALVAFSFIPVCLFVYFFSTRSRWRDDPLGISLMVNKITMSLIFFFIFIPLLGWDFEGRRYIQTGLFMILTLTFWYDLYALRQTQRLGRRAIPKEIRMFKRKIK